MSNIGQHILCCWAWSFIKKPTIKAYCDIVAKIWDTAFQSCTRLKHNESYCSKLEDTQVENHAVGLVLLLECTSSLVDFS